MIPQPGFFKKENSYIRWTKTGCHGYRITNKTSPIGGYILKINVTRLDGQYVTPILTNLILNPGESYDLSIKYDKVSEYGGDGVYSITAVPINLTPIYPSVDSGANSRLAIYTFPTVTTNTNILGLGTSPVMGGSNPDIFDALIHGAANFSSPPTSLNNLKNAITAWNSGNVVEIIPPNGTSPSGLYLGTSPSWRIVFFNNPGDVFTTGQADALTIREGGIGGIETDIFPTFQCYWGVPEPTTTPPVPTHVTGFTIDGDNVLGRVYDIATEATLFLADLNIYFAANGINAFAADYNGNAYIISSPCLNIESITYAQVSEAQNTPLVDYIYELCDTYACYAKLLNAYLCLNRDCTSCHYQSIEYKRLMEMTALLNGALLPAISADTLAYMGDFGFYEKRAQNATTIANLFQNVRALVFQCGYGCEDKKPCSC